jgi:hypothetical protein
MEKFITNYQSTGAYGWDYILGSVPEFTTSTLGRIKVVEHGGSVEDVSDSPFWLNVKKSE